MESRREEILFHHDGGEKRSSFVEYTRPNVGYRGVFLGSFEYREMSYDGFIMIHGHESGRLRGPNGVKQIHVALFEIMRKENNLQPGKYLILACYNWKRPARVVFKNGIEFHFVKPPHAEDRAGILAIDSHSRELDKNTYQILVYEKR